MATIPNVTQVPIQQPISMNNLMHPVWVRFFEALSRVANENAVFSMQKMSGEINQVGDEVLQISDGIGDINTLIAAINASLLGVDANILSLQTQVATLKGRVSTLESQNQDLTARVEALENAP